MSEFMFGVSRTKPTRRDSRKIERIAKRHGATFVEANLPGTGYQSWFSAPNLGSPFDQERAAAVAVDLETAGLA
jgi:hypothetical protein